MSTHPAADVAALPDFRNLGVVWRALVVAEVANLVSLYARSKDGFGDLIRVRDTGPTFELTLLLALGALAALSPRIQRLEPRLGWVVVLAVCAMTAVCVDAAMAAALGQSVGAGLLKAAVVACSVTVLIGIYLDWRRRVLSPALTKARLAALQARIRPHFLFNGINTALSVVREDPGRAERILLDMSDLFRVVLKESRSLVPLENELAVARAYLDVEEVRLGGRLAVVWHIDEAPLDARVPVLFLQPLLENAVWHGIEPGEKGGVIDVRLARRRARLEIEVSNPVPDNEGRSGAGNGMALDNIRERLALHYDEEASMTVTKADGHFRVRIVLPIKVRGGFEDVAGRL